MKQTAKRTLQNICDELSNKEFSSDTFDFLVTELHRAGFEVRDLEETNDNDSDNWEN